jgi:hypothetical protein
MSERLATCPSNSTASPPGRYSNLARMLSNVHKTRVANAQYLADDIKD